MKTSFYTEEELLQIGLRSYGRGVLISRNVKFYSPELIQIGDNVRIDDFCILSGNITIKSHIHISAYCALYGGGGIVMDDFSGLSPRCTLLSATDDFSGEYMVGSCVRDDCRNVIKSPIVLQKYVQIGAGTTILPGVVVAEGVAVGAMSLVRKSLSSWKIYAGNPLRLLKERSCTLLNFTEVSVDGENM